MSTISLSVVYSINKTNGFSNNNTMAWKCPDDIKNFHRTINHPNGSTLICGRNTWLTIKNIRLFNGYQIIVVSRKSAEMLKCEAATSLNDALTKVKNKNVFVIGGVTLLEETLKHPLNETVYESIIKDETKCDQQFFPILEEYDEVTCEDRGTFIYRVLKRPKDALRVLSENF